MATRALFLPWAASRQKRSFRKQSFCSKQPRHIPPGRTKPAASPGNWRGSCLTASPVVAGTHAGPNSGALRRETAILGPISARMLAAPSCRMLGIAWSSKRASRISCPDTPKTSVNTLPILMLASSTFWTRFRSLQALLSTCLRRLVKSRNSRTGLGGMKLAQMRPCRSRWASQPSRPSRSCAFASFDVLTVCQHARDASFQNVEHGFPVRPCALHNNVCSLPPRAKLATR